MKEEEKKDLRKQIPRILQPEYYLAGDHPGLYACSLRDMGSIPEVGRSPGEGNGNPPLYSCLENFMDRGSWWAKVHGVAKSWTQLSN